jgi:hypothetical protein
VEARDQYIPEDGAAGTSGAVRGSARGGKGVCEWERRVRREDETVRLLVEVELARRACEAAGAGADVEEGLLAMAEVERKLTGRREEVPVLLPAEESCLSRRTCWAWDCACEASWCSLTWVTMGDFGVVVEGKAGDGPGPLVDGDLPAGEAAKVEVGGLAMLAAAMDAALLAGNGVAEDCDRWRIVSSEGLRRRSWLLDARWPGVWLRGIGGARSLASSA